MNSRFHGVFSLVLVGFPQCWLWKSRALFCAFWVLSLASLVEIIFLFTGPVKIKNVSFAARQAIERGNDPE